MRCDLVVPELGLGGRPVTVSLWLVELGAEVTEGDRIVELAADSVTVDLPAPTSGTLIETLVGEDDQVQSGQVLGVIETEEL